MFSILENYNAMAFYSEKACGMAFDEGMRNLKWGRCFKCNEKILTSDTIYKCHHAQNCWHYSSLNNMDPKDVPDELRDLTFIEEQLKRFDIHRGAAKEI